MTCGIAVPRPAGKPRAWGTPPTPDRTTDTIRAPPGDAPIASGLDRIGLDISQTAIERLAQHIPARAQHLVHGDLSALPADATYPLVIGIQVFYSERLNPVLLAKINLSANGCSRISQSSVTGIAGGTVCAHSAQSASA
jgi:hypothetical protein